MSTLGRRWGHFQARQVDLVVDVGANAGQYGQALRSMGYRGQIVSVEPLPDAWPELERRSVKDSRWRAIHLALGKSDSIAPMFVAENSYSSSLYPTTSDHERAAPGARAIGQIDVEVHRLEGVADDLIGSARTPLLKVDTQGSELDILEGAGAAIARFAGVQVELSLVPMYVGAPTIWEVVDWLEARGFILCELEPEFSDPVTGRLLQVNGIFFRSADAPAASAPGLPGR
jgi:FkbM family methyltransferase